MLRRLLAPLLAWAKGAVRIIVASAITGIGLNAATADPYMSIILSSATYRERFIEARLEPYVESASIAGSGSIFSPLIPWNVHGAFVAGTLGIGVLAYAPYAVLLWLTPVVLIGIGIARFSHDSISGTGPAEEAYGPEPQELPERRASV
jgi:NhaC family Na+:H+ antiporter